MSNTHDFINALHRSHLDNGKRVYYRADDGKGTIVPVMPATPFIFEYFLFNSIYQHNWESTGDCLVIHESRRGKKGLLEWEQQVNLLDHLKKECLKRPELLGIAFSFFKELVDLDGGWTKITPDHNLTGEKGEDFFGSLQKIQEMLGRKMSENLVPDFFAELNACREFVGKVRNNIFHGAKSLDQIYEEAQRRRIEVYYLFVSSLNSLFFLTRHELNQASTKRSFPQVQLPGMVEKTFYLSSMKTLEMQAEHLMKSEDTELIPWANTILKPLREGGEPLGTLFYPSSGCDIITPVLIGLPFCTEFHFYDKGEVKKWTKALGHLRKILGNPKGFRMPKSVVRSFEVEFEYAGVKRRILRVRASNEKSLESNSPLIFFFHRGDGEGEGGSDQPWDSEWFHRWKHMIPYGRPCAVLTDGIPHGIDKELARHLTMHPTLCSTPHRGRYHCGIISSSH